MKNLTSKLLFVFFLFSGPAGFAHDRSEVGGFLVVFGGEPEPMIVDERQNLAWRFTDAKTDELITDMETLEAVITFAGKKSAPFTARGSRRTPGIYKTVHIFTQPGGGEVTLSFKRAGSDTVNTITFSFTVHPRSDIEIPKQAV